MFEYPSVMQLYEALMLSIDTTDSISGLSLFGCESFGHFLWCSFTGDKSFLVTYIRVCTSGA